MGSDRRDGVSDSGSELRCGFACGRLHPFEEGQREHAMSLGIAFKGPEGIVLAADSRVTLTAQVAGGITMPATFDNAIKLLRVKGQDYVGAVTYGVGAIGQIEPRTAHSFIPEFETDLAQADVGRLPVYDFAQRLSDFFTARWKASMPDPWTGPDMIFLVGGFNENEPYGRVYEVHVPSNPAPTEHNPNSFGITWGGQGEFAGRVLNGYDPQLLDIVRNTLAPQASQMATFISTLQSTLTTPIPYQFLPLQDCVDLSIFLIKTTSTIQNWVVGIRGVGGAVDVATITRSDGFAPVQQKSIKGE